jgi:hypothetical protein
MMLKAMTAPISGQKEPKGVVKITLFKYYQNWYLPLLLVHLHRTRLFSDLFYGKQKLPI